MTEHAHSPLPCPISDETLADWYARWPSILPTSVPHEQVRMLIEELLQSRRAHHALVEALTNLVAEAETVIHDHGEWHCDSGTAELPTAVLAARAALASCAERERGAGK